MTWVGLVWKNLLRRPVRTLLTSAGVALGVGLIVALLSISAGAQNTAGDLIHLGRADFGLFQSGVSDATRSLLPVALEARVAKDPGVAQTARIFLFVTTVQGQDSSLVFGLTPDEFPMQRLTLLSGDRSGALIGDTAAKVFHVGPARRSTSTAIPTASPACSTAATASRTWASCCRWRRCRRSRSGRAR